MINQNCARKILLLNIAKTLATHKQKVIDDETILSIAIDIAKSLREPKLQEVFKSLGGK